MRCPYCRRDNDRVVDTRGIEDGFAIRRRRVCISCNRRFTTFERIEEAVMRVIKKDLGREAFAREKIKQGLARACWKRPVSEDQIEQMVLGVENEIYANFEDEIPSRQIGELVMRQLAEVDQVAYVRFASVYRDFNSVRDFVHELEPMLNKKSLAE